MGWGKAYEKGDKVTILQWMILTLILFGSLVYILITYSASMKRIGQRNADEALRSNMIQVEKSFMSEIARIESVTDTFAAMIAMDGGIVASRENAELLKKLAGNCDAIDGYIANVGGSAVFCSGEEGNVLDRPGFAKSVRKTSRLSEIYLDQKNDAYVIAVTSPILGENSVKGVVSLLYPAESFGNVIQKRDYDGKTQFMLMTKDGVITEYIGSSVIQRGDSIFDVVALSEKSAEFSMDKLARELRSGRAGSFWCVENGKTGKLFYQPMNQGEWYVVELYTENYVNVLINKSYGETRKVVIQIAFAMIAFIILLAAFTTLNGMVYRKQNRELQNKAETDLLTGLLNKIATEKHIEEYLENEGKDSQAMLCILDLDNFKKINDTLGHAFGDEVLSSLGRNVRSQFRGTDIFGRIGGDEFIVFLKKIETEEIRQREAVRVAGLFENFEVGDYVKYSPTASIGAAMYPKDGKTFEELYKAADRGVYLAKKKGKNQLCFCDEE